VIGVPKLLRVETDGRTTVIASGERNGPWTGVTFHNGAFFIAEGGVMEGGRILRITKDGAITALISALPSYGDHHTNGRLFATGTYILVWAPLPMRVW
jgi:hypothetical protein